MNDDLQTTTLHQLIDRLRRGDAGAENELLRRVERRVERLCRAMLGRFWLVRSAEQTGDVLQNSLLRLLGSLRELRPMSTREFYGLAAEQIRRELLDLAKYYGAQRRMPKGGRPQGLAAPVEASVPALDPSFHDDKAEDLEQWQRLHEAIAELPALEREVVGLLFYHGWTQNEVAHLLQIDERTVRRKWVKACLTIKDALGCDISQV